MGEERVITLVRMLKIVEKRLAKVPPEIRRKLALWIESVNRIGLESTRKILSYHDEPLKGTLKGYRSIRLSIQWRAIYVIQKDGTIEFVEIQEVTPHDYKP